MTDFSAQVTNRKEALIALEAGADWIFLASDWHNENRSDSLKSLSNLQTDLDGSNQVNLLIKPPNSAAVSVSSYIEKIQKVYAVGIAHITISLRNVDDPCEFLSALGTLRQNSVLSSDLQLTVRFLADQPFSLSWIENAAMANCVGVIWDMDGDSDSHAGFTHSSLTEYCSLSNIEAFVRRARAVGLKAGFGGGLSFDDIDRLVPLQPDFLLFDTALHISYDVNRINPIACQVIRVRLDQALSAMPINKIEDKIVRVEQWKQGDRRQEEKQIKLAQPVATKHDSLAMMADRELAGVVSAMVSSSDPLPPNSLDRIFVEGYELPCQIGIYPEEQNKTQSVRFDIELSVKPRPHPFTDDMQNLFNYDNIIEIIRGLTAEGHINMLETLAEQIAARCLAHPLAQEITVRLQKLGRHPCRIGIEITRQTALE